jgi:hypothetical protein
MDGIIRGIFNTEKLKLVMERGVSSCWINGSTARLNIQGNSNGGPYFGWHFGPMLCVCAGSRTDLSWDLSGCEW